MMTCKCYSLILKTVLIEKQILTEEKGFMPEVSKIENLQLLQSASEIFSCSSQLQKSIQFSNIPSMHFFSDLSDTWWTPNYSSSGSATWTDLRCFFLIWNTLQDFALIGTIQVQQTCRDIL